MPQGPNPDRAPGRSQAGPDTLGGSTDAPIGRGGVIRAGWLRATLNRWRRRIWHAWAYRMVFGEQAADGRLLPHTRIAPSTCIDAAHRLQLADHVFIGQFNFIDASAGLVIE